MLKDRKGGCSGLTWEEYKSLTFTNQVKKESLITTGFISSTLLPQFRFKSARMTTGVFTGTGFYSDKIFLFD